MEEKVAQRKAHVTSKRRLIWRVLKAGGAAVAVLLTAMFFFVYFVCDGNVAASLLLPRVESGLGVTLSYAAADLSWEEGRRVAFTLRKVEARRPGEERPAAVFAAITASVDLDALLRGVVLVEKARVIRPTVWLSPLAESHRSRETSVGVVPPFWARIVKVTDITVEDGRVRATLPCGEAACREVDLLREVTLSVLDLNYFGAREFLFRAAGGDNGGGGRVRVLGTIDAPEGLGGSLRGAGNLFLDGVNASLLKAVSGYFGMDLPVSGGQLFARADAKFGVGACSVRGSARADGLVFSPGTWFVREARAGTVSLSFAADFRESLLHLTVADLSAPGLRLSGQVRVGGLFAGNVRPAFSLDRAEIDLEQLYPLLPTALLNNADRARLASARFKGRILMQGASWTPRPPPGAGPAQDPSLNAMLEGVSGFIPSLGLPVENVSGRISLSADELKLNEIVGTFGNSPMSLNGSVVDLGEAPNGELFLSMKAHAGDIGRLLQFRELSGNTPRWLGMIHDLDGIVEVKLTVKGPLGSPRLDGFLAFDDFRCGVNGFPLPLKGLKGSVRFEGGGVVFQSLVGTLGLSPFEVTGRASKEHISVTVESRPTSKDLREVGVFPNGMELTGKPKVTLKIEGKPTEPAYKLAADLSAAGVSLAKIIKKPPGAPLSILASGVMAQNGIHVEDGSISSRGARVALKGIIGGREKLEFLVNLPPRGIETANLLPLVDPMWRLTSGGRIEGDLTIRLGADSRTEGTVKAELLFSHVSFHPPGMHKPMSGVTGRLLWRGDTVQCALDRVRIGNTVVTGALNYTVAPDPKMDMQLTLPFLDTTDFTAPPGYVTDVTWGQWIKSNAIIRLIARSNGRTLIRVEKGKTHQRAFSDFSAAVEATKGILRVPNWKTAFADGTLQGSALFDLRETTEKPLTLEFQGDNLRMERLLVGPQDNLRIESELIMEGRMEYRLTASPRNHGIARSGIVEARLREGVIQRFEVLSKLFSLVNLGALVSGRFTDMISQGLPFSRMTIDAEVYDAKWKIKSLKLLSDAAAVDASGMYFSDQDRVDFRVDVAPLVGVDRILSGLFGNLITRDGKTLTTTFRIRGLSHSPDVRLEPLEAFRLQ